MAFSFRFPSESSGQLFSTFHLVQQTLCGIIAIRQNSPRKYVGELGIAHFVFMVQYCGAVHTVSVGSVSLMVAMHCLSGPHFFLGIFP